MKQTIFILLFLISSRAMGQWTAVDGNQEVDAFGVHDTSLFYSGHNTLIRVNPLGGADNGLNFSEGQFTSFASLGKYFYAANYNVSSGFGIIFISSDNGSHWSSSAGGPVGSNGTYIFGNYGTAPLADTTVVGRSRDSGKTWEKLPYPAGMNYIGDGPYMYMNPLRAGIMRSFDSGTTWTPVHSPFNGVILTMGTILFVYQPHVNHSYWSGFSQAWPNNGVLIISRDSGANWDTIHVMDSKAQLEYVSTVAVSGKYIFVGGYNAVTNLPNDVYVSDDTGRTWRQVEQANTSLHHVLALGIYDSMLYASMTDVIGNLNFATYRRPIKDFDKPFGVVHNGAIIGDTILLYPNPTRSAITIEAGSAEIYNVTVMNLLGEEMLALPANRTSEFQLDLSKLRSGSYFLRLETSRGTIVKKVVRE